MLFFPGSEQFFTGSSRKTESERERSELRWGLAKADIFFGFHASTHVYITKCTSPLWLLSDSFQRPSQTSKVEHIFQQKPNSAFGVMFGYRRACCKHWHNRSSPICARASSNIGTIYVYTTKCQRENEEFPGIHHPLGSINRVHLTIWDMNFHAPNHQIKEATLVLALVFLFIFWVTLNPSWMYSSL